MAASSHNCLHCSSFSPFMRFPLFGAVLDIVKKTPLLRESFGQKRDSERQHRSRRTLNVMQRTNSVGHILAVRNLLAVCVLLLFSTSSRPCQTPLFVLQQIILLHEF